jgi:hypothetical protein
MVRLSMSKQGRHSHTRQVTHTTLALLILVISGKLLISSTKCLRDCRCANGVRARAMCESSIAKPGSPQRNQQWSRKCCVYSNMLRTICRLLIQRFRFRRGNRLNCSR